MPRSLTPSRGRMLLPTLDFSPPMPPLRSSCYRIDAAHRTVANRHYINRHLYRIMRTGPCCSSRTSWPVGYGMLSGRRPPSSLARSFRDLRPSLWPFARKHDKVRPLMIACMCPRGFECPGVPYLAEISAFSQQLAYTCMPGHEPLPPILGIQPCGQRGEG